jgi:hypothetical protein
MFSHKEFLDATIAGQILFSTSYLISSLVVAGNDYAGFVAVLTGVLYILSTAVTYYGIRRSPNRLNYGVILGGTVILIFISLEAAIFWGQYGTCGE